MSFFFLSPLEGNKETDLQAWVGFLLCLITDGHIIADINDYISLGISNRTQV